MKDFIQFTLYIQIIGGIHGLFLTFLLLRLPEKRTLANKILGVLLLAISYLLLWGALHDSHSIPTPGRIFPLTFLADLTGRLMEWNSDPYLTATAMMRAACSWGEHLI